MTNKEIEKESSLVVEDLGNFFQKQVEKGRSPASIGLGLYAFWTAFKEMVQEDLDRTLKSKIPWN